MTTFIAWLIGYQDDPRLTKLRSQLLCRTLALARSGETFDIVDQDVDPLPFDAECVAVVFCRNPMRPSEIAAIEHCRRFDIPIIPVVESLAVFVQAAPAEVQDLNGFELALSSLEGDVAELAGLTLEWLGLQRTKRKIFISYARRDAVRVAQQLREAFTARWYSVFLDTLSIRPGAVFQEELLQELADSDVVVLLNSPSVKDRPFVQKEIAFADQTGVGGVQVVWPDEKPLSEGAYFAPLLLDGQKADIRAGAVDSLTPAGVVEVVRLVAELRTNLQQIREDEIVRPIRDYARNRGWDAVRFLGRHIELRKDSDRIQLDVALGVPTSHDLERTCRTKAFCAQGGLVFDPLGITNRQSAHLDYFRSALGLRFFDPKNALHWTLLQ